MANLDPGIQAYFSSLSAEFPPLPANPTPLERRARYWAVCAHGRTPLPSNVTMNDVQLDLACGKVGARLFFGHDESNTPVPTIIYFHGGGWVVGDTDTHTVTCARLAAEANALVASIDFPLAPENGWAHITEACFQAACAITEDRSGSGPIALVGDSAGAHLAAVVAIRARDSGAFSPALQALIFPCIAPKFDTASYETYATGYGLTRADMEWYWGHFAGADAALNDYRIAPNRAASLARLPKSYIVTAGFDPLKDDGVDYFNALRRAEVDVFHDNFDSMPHGFLRMAKYSAAVSGAISHVNARIGKLLRE